MQATNHKILVVDDEEDVHRITELVLKTLTYDGRGVEIYRADSGAEALTLMRSTRDIAVILLDVVMESGEAGLDACRAIREDIRNKNVRILLRTGQPGMAPEEKVAAEYDIDGYLAKSELTSTRLRTTVRSALKAFIELSGLEAERNSLQSIRKSIPDISEATLWSDLKLAELPTTTNEAR